MKLHTFIDSTLLRANAMKADIDSLCAEAGELGCYAVVVNPCFIGYAARLLEGTAALPATVVGFPLGASHAKIKLLEARQAADDGARELDIVANIGLLTDGDFAIAEKELRDIRAAIDPGIVIKVIVETPLLPRDRWKGAVEAVVSSGCQFVKTATGFSGPTQVDHVSELAKLADGRVKVKAAGGVRTVKQALDMINAGASRIGTSSARAIIEESREGQKK
jgi:deoxyribose-phosphate aldolase